MFLPVVQGILLQIFSKPLSDRPTVFIEIIQRIGCEREVRVHTSLACAQEHEMQRSSPATWMLSSFGLRCCRLSGAGGGSRRAHPD